MVSLTPDQRQRAEQMAPLAVAFCEERSADLPAALVRYLWHDGSASDVAHALARYQNADGGFGKRLEPDIHAPASNPFAARIAMQYLLFLPNAETTDIRAGLKDWLVSNQHYDGDWHFSDETKAGEMQPWFAAWEFPSLNPACCLAGLAHALNLSTESMMTRVADLFAAKASIETIQAGGFYDVMPYVEYSLGASLPETYRDAIAERIITSAGDGSLVDAEHFFTLALGGSPEIARRIPDAVITAQIDRMLAEPLADGGWPTPYDDAWRVWVTAGNMAVLARLRRGV